MAVKTLRAVEEGQTPIKDAGGVFDELQAASALGPARLLKAASVGLAEVTVSKLSTLKVTVFDGLPVAPTLVAERPSQGWLGQYQRNRCRGISSLPVRGLGKKRPFEPLSMKLVVRDWPAKLVVKLSDDQVEHGRSARKCIVRLRADAEDQASSAQVGATSLTAGSSTMTPLLSAGS